MTRFLLRVVLWGLLVFALLISVSLVIGRGIHSAQLTFLTSNRMPHIYDVRMNQTLPFHFSDTESFMLAWSPDGRYLAYGVLDQTLRPTAQTLRLFDTRTQSVQNILDVNSADAASAAIATSLNITWSSDSTRLLYITRSGQATIYHVGDGAQTLYGENIARAAWSPADERIAAIHYVDERHWLIVANADGTDRRRLLSMAEANALHWSPDGRYLILLSGTNLMGEARLTLIESRHGTIREYGGFIDRAYPLSWLPDGRTVYYADTGDNNTYTLDIDSGATASLETPQIDYVIPPMFSPDGAWQASIPIKLNGVTIADIGIYLTQAGTDEWQAIARTNNFNFLWRP